MTMLQAMLRKTSLLLLAIFGLTAFTLAQSVTGTVTDAKGDPVSGASVTLKGTNKGTTTNAQGMYTLNAAAGSTLEISVTGFIQQNIKVTGAGPFNISLQPAINNLNEVVVIGYGTTRKRDLTGNFNTLLNKTGYTDIQC